MRKDVVGSCVCCILLGTIHNCHITWWKCTYEYFPLWIVSVFVGIIIAPASHHTRISSIFNSIFLFHITITTNTTRNVYTRDDNNEVLFIYCIYFEILQIAIWFHNLMQRWFCWDSQLKSITKVYMKIIHRSNIKRYVWDSSQ